MHLRRRAPGGFTLVELLVVIAIIGILVALLLPAIQAAREAARRADCVNRLKQIALACLNHHDVKNHFPSATEIYPTKNNNGKAYWGYLIQVLPYMEHHDLIDSLDLNVFWQDDPNRTLLYRIEVPFLRCPSQAEVESTFVDPPGGSGRAELSSLRTHYMAVMGAKTKCGTPTPPADSWPATTYTMMPAPNGNPNGACSSGGVATNGVIHVNAAGGSYYPSRVNIKDITDGTTYTFLVGEISWLVGPQRIWAIGTATGKNTGALYSFHYSSKNVMWPLNTAYRAGEGQPASPYENNDMSFGSLHPGGCHFAMCDGSVQFIRDDVPIETLRALASRKSEEPITRAF